MDHFKSKYLEMKLKYINAKNKSENKLVGGKIKPYYIRNTEAVKAQFIEHDYNSKILHRNDKEKNPEDKTDYIKIWVPNNRREPKDIHEAWIANFFESKGIRIRETGTQDDPIGDMNWFFETAPTRPSGSRFRGRYLHLDADEKKLVRYHMQLVFISRHTEWRDINEGRTIVKTTDEVSGIRRRATKEEVDHLLDRHLQPLLLRHAALVAMMVNDDAKAQGASNNQTNTESINAELVVIQAYNEAPRRAEFNEEARERDGDGTGIPLPPPHGLTNDQYADMARFKTYNELATRHKAKVTAKLHENHPWRRGQPTRTVRKLDRDYITDRYVRPIAPTDAPTDAPAPAPAPDLENPTAWIQNFNKMLANRNTTQCTVSTSSTSSQAPANTTALPASHQLPCARQTHLRFTCDAARDNFGYKSLIHYIRQTDVDVYYTANEHSIKRLYNQILSNPPFYGQLNLKRDELEIQKEKKLIDFLLSDYLYIAKYFEVDNELLAKLGQGFHRYIGQDLATEEKKFVLNFLRKEITNKFVNDRRKQDLEYYRDEHGRIIL